MGTETTKSAAEQAWETLTADGAGEAPEVEVAPEVEAAPVEDAAPELDAVEPETEESQARPARLRNPDGTFAETPKEKAAAKAAAAVKPTPPSLGQQKPAAKPDAAKPAQTEVLKAPNSLKQTEKEAFARAPREVQEFIIRRERDAAVNHQRMAESAKFGEAAREAVSPYEQAIRARGGEPISYVRQLLQAEHVLQYGSPSQKAAVVHSLLTNYGVDVDAVNALLQGQAPRAQPMPTPQAPQQRGLTPADVEALLEQREAQRQIADFSKSRPYFEQLRPRMAALIRAHAEDGLSLGLDEAYDLATQADPQMRAALARTKPAATAVSPSRVRAAAGSLKSRPLNPTQGAAKKSAAEMAWEAITGE